MKWLVLSDIIIAPLYPHRNIFQAGRIKSRNTDCRPRSAISQLNFHKTSQTDVLFQQLFQTGITLIHHWYLLLSKSGHIYIHMYQQRMNSLQSNNIKKEVIMKTAIC